MRNESLLTDLRKAVINGLIAIECGLLIVFVILFAQWHLLAVGILEWIIAFLLIPYLWLIGVYMT
jgi:hypothetical protein